jgi:hypothetical protein
MTIDAAIFFRGNLTPNALAAGEFRSRLSKDKRAPSRSTAVRPMVGALGPRFSGRPNAAAQAQ